MKTLQKYTTFAAIGFGLAALPALADQPRPGTETAAEIVAPTQTITELAAGNEDFSTLVTALKAAGLDEALNGEGPFTVFAPTNEAFEKIPPADLAALLLPENKEKLSQVLTYHVIPGTLMAKDVKPGDAVTLQGQKVTVAVVDDVVMVEDAKVTKTDIETTNGVIHVIDTVLMPKN